ncbi:HNH endonuclease [Nitratireductor sp. XY-223]|uniref:HNH endonuclease n=1 Tax=Nitratireductor sp. XY-223 TaxID=2561926 RepID=UPI00145B3472|nr:HNH endonuclease [Nitratireductor sp. XY-223]
MSPDPETLATVISNETGLEFTGSTGTDDEGHRWIALTPADHDPTHTFAIRIRLEWRRLSIGFESGKFAGPLLEAMSDAEKDARAVFRSVMQDCEQHGAVITIQPNGKDHSYGDNDMWNEAWNRLTFGIRKGNIELGAEDGIPDGQLVREWTSRFVAAVVALLPLEEHEPSDVEGFPEAAIQKVTVNRYERDRRNRSAALAIHGCSCTVCGMNFEDSYGLAAAGFIEIHHVVPVSEVAENYVIDPRYDLAPLCSNCHSVAHRRSPPFTIEELRGFLAKRDTQTS